MIQLSELDAVLRSRLPMGELVTNESSSSSTSEGGATVARAEMRYVFKPVAGERVDLEQAVADVIDTLRGMDYHVEDKRTREEEQGRRLAGTIFYAKGEGEGDGELAYRLRHDAAAETVEIDWANRQRTP